MTMYDRIKELRLSKGLSQTELAKIVGYKDKSAVAKIEAGTVDIPRSKIQAFADAFNVTPSYLMDGKTETDKEKSSPELSEEEKGLLELFRELPEDKQDMALEMLRAALHKK